MKSKVNRNCIKIMQNTSCHIPLNNHTKAILHDKIVICTISWDGNICPDWINVLLVHCMLIWIIFSDDISWEVKTWDSKTAFVYLFIWGKFVSFSFNVEVADCSAQHICLKVICIMTVIHKRKIAVAKNSLYLSMIILNDFSS